MSTTLNEDQVQGNIPAAQYDVVVLGAGPYGLSVSSHLMGHGLKVATFGKPIFFWRNHMPSGMLLRSFWHASSLSDPKSAYSIGHYFKEHGIEPPEPLPIETFIDYGLWFQKHAVPDIDETYIEHIERFGDRYRVTLQDGRVIYSTSVVMAPGLHYYQYSPEQYKHLPRSLVSHTGDHHDLSRFSGQKVAIIGGGQAALETAALLNEQNTDVTIILRRAIKWLSVFTSDSRLATLIHTIRAPKAGMGEGWVNVVLEKLPYTLHRTFRPWKNRALERLHGPAGAYWLPARIIGKVHVKEYTMVEAIEAINDEKAVRLQLSDGTVLEVDHVILATGYRPDVKSLPMLGQDIKDVLQTYRGSPVLTNWFESNVPGLYFVGFSSARSFGPFYRFVVGAEAAAKRVSAAANRYVAAHR